MPHRVASFFRASTENIHAISNIKASIRQNSRPRRPLDKQISYSSSISDEGEDLPPLNMVDSADTAPKKHRLSLPFGRSSRENHDNPHACLAWKIESPPIVFYGDADTSTGALVSGQMQLTVKEESLEVESFEATLRVHVQQNKPFANHCSDCTNQYTELKRWVFLANPTRLQRGTHDFPFSILLEGHLPATMDTPLASISYEFKADAILGKGTTSSGTSLPPVKFERTLDVKRALPEPDLPHHSVRVFPPTNIKASAHYMQIIHPSGTNNVQFKLDGLTSTNARNSTIEFWKLKKITWKLEETIKTVAPACEKHAPTGANAHQKGLQRVETRILGEKFMHEGWKSDYTAKDGTVEFEFDYGVHANKHYGHGPRFACDSKSRDGTEVSHALMVEMVVSKEWAPVGKPHMATQTGTGRILRMHYHVTMTDHPGMGVSWDNEAPPVYQDVPPSPPAYPEEAPLIEYDDLEQLDGLRRSAEHESEGNRSD